MTKHQPPLTRRDATGHMNPAYEHELLEDSQEDRSERADESAYTHHLTNGDGLGEKLGEAFVESATSGEDAGQQWHEQTIPEEQGGPFVTSNAAIEFASGTDASNIADATCEPFPKTSKSNS